MAGLFHARNATKSKKPEQPVGASHSSFFCAITRSRAHMASGKAPRIARTTAQEMIDSTKMIRKRYPKVPEASARGVKKRSLASAQPALWLVDSSPSQQLTLGIASSVPF